MTLQRIEIIGLREKLQGQSQLIAKLQADVQRLLDQDREQRLQRERGGSSASTVQDWGASILGVMQGVAVPDAVGAAFPVVESRSRFLTRQAGASAGQFVLKPSRQMASGARVWAFKTFQDNEPALILKTVGGLVAIPLTGTPGEKFVAVVTSCWIEPAEVDSTITDGCTVKLKTGKGKLLQYFESQDGNKCLSPDGDEISIYNGTQFPVRLDQVVEVTEVDDGVFVISAANAFSLPCVTTTPLSGRISGEYGTGTVRLLHEPDDDCDKDEALRPITTDGGGYVDVEVKNPYEHDPIPVDTFGKVNLGPNGEWYVEGMDCPRTGTGGGAGAITQPPMLDELADVTVSPTEPSGAPAGEFWVEATPQAPSVNPVAVALDDLVDVTVAASEPAGLSDGAFWVDTR